jgi:hypothetical protein
MPATADRNDRRPLPSLLASQARYDLKSDCPCVTAHSPVPTRLQRHWLLPEALGGRDCEGNWIQLCPATHDAAHHAIEVLIRCGPFGHPDLRRFPIFARLLARLALELWRDDHPIAWPSEDHPNGRH